jgi:hypothetical protein
MKYALVLAALVAASACTPGAPPVNEQTTRAINQRIVEPYLTIQGGLAKDRVDEVKANAGQIATAASGLGAPAAGIATSAVRLSAAADLVDARIKFAALSEAITAYLEAYHVPMPEGVRVAYCPMAKKPWLQRGATIANPYYGSEMLGCGSFR